jgi:hypothetical protein
MASAMLLLKNSSLAIEMKIVVWKKEFDLLATKKRKPARLTKKKSERPNISFSKMKAVIKSFRVTRCYISLDFEEVEWNGILFPLFYWVSRVTGKNIGINFNGKQVVQLQIKNNFARMILAYINK